MFKSGIIVAFFTLLSRLFGLAREFFIAYNFGTSAIADCVNIAFRFPNLFRRIFGEGALSSVFVPIFSKKLLISEQEAKKFSGNVIGWLLIVLVVITLLIEIFMPQLMIALIPGFYHDPLKFNLAVDLCRITTPYLIFLSMVALFGGMLNSVGKFWALAFAPVIMSTTVIVFTYYFERFGTAHYSISYSLIMAGILQILFMYICLKRAHLTFQPTLDTHDESVIELLGKLGPAILSSGTQQLSLFISQSLASFLPGAISILNYADRLYQLPMALIGVTFGTILLPALSRLYKSENYQQINKLQNTAIKIALFISIPAAFGLGAMSEPIIHLIYERGEFARSDTIITAQVLSVFAFGLPAFTLSKIFTPVYYANLDTKTPMHISMYSLLANAVLNILLMIPFGPIGIAAGFTLSSWFNLWLLGRGVNKFGEFKISENTKIFIEKTIIASVLMFGFIIITKFYLGDVFFADRVLIKIVATFGVIFTSIIIFVILSILLGLGRVINEYRASK